MGYGTKKAKAKNQSNNILNAVGMGSSNKKTKVEQPAIVKATRINVGPAISNEPQTDLKLQQALDENRNVAEQLAAKRNVRRASNRQLLSSSRLETLGQGA